MEKNKMFIGKFIRSGNKKALTDNISKITKVLTAGEGVKVDWSGILPENAGAAANLETKTIIMPKVDWRKLTEEQAHLCYAYATHERRHILLTDPKSGKEVAELKLNNKLVEWELYQRIEDTRIELNEEYKLKGDTEDLMWNRQKDFEEFKKEINNFRLHNPIGFLMVSLHYALMGFNDITIPEEWKPLYDSGRKILNDGRHHKSRKMKKKGTKITGQLAKEIAESWRDLIQEKIENGEVQETDDPSKSNIPSDMNKNSDSEKNKNNSEKKSKSQNNSEKKSKSQNNSEKKSKSQNNSENKKQKNKDKEEITPEEAEKLLNEMFNSGQDEIPINFDDKTEKIRQIQEIVPPKHGKEEWLWYDKEIRVEQNKSQFDLDQASISNKSNYVTNIIKTSLLAITQTRKMTNLKRGKIDRRNLHKLGFNNFRVMKKTTEGRSLDAAVQLVIDMSGSMNGEKIKTARKIAILLGNACYAAKVPFEVIGYDTSSIDHSEINSNIDKGRKNCDRSEELVRKFIFKSFKEKWHKEKFRLGNCKAGNNNIDHIVVEWGAIRLYKQPQKRKLQIVICDGQPQAKCNTYSLYENLIETNKKIEEAGIQQFCFGIKCNGVKRFYPNHIIVNNIDELDIKTLKIFDDYLKGRNIRKMNSIQNYNDYDPYEDY